MSDETCPNCSAPFLDIRMMGISGNQRSQAFRCESIFVPVANRLVVKTYACETIAELRAHLSRLQSTLDNQSTVPDICNAYESGVGHRGRPTANVNPYPSGSDCFAAYAIGAASSATPSGEGRE